MTTAYPSAFPTALPTSFLTTRGPTEGGIRGACPADVTVLKKDGVTEVDPARAVRIMDQNKSTVRVRLFNAWTNSSSPADFVDSIFYNYQHSVFDEKCYEKQAVRGGADYDDVTIRCLSSAPIARIEICVADGTDGTETFLDRERDAAVPPKCCHSDLPEGTPTVCYDIVVRCETACVPGGVGFPGRPSSGSGLRGGGSA